MLASCMFCSARDPNCLIFEQNRGNYIREDDLNTRFGGEICIRITHVFQIVCNSPSNWLGARVKGFSILWDDPILHSHCLMNINLLSSKHREESWKYDAQGSIFDELRGVRKCFSNIVLSVWYISIEPKLRRKRRNKLRLWLLCELSMI